MTTHARKPDPTLRKQDGTFQKGVSGNPSGRPKGVRTGIARALDALAAADAAAVLAKTVELAKDGDIGAAQLIMRRAWPAPKGRVMENVALPVLATAADAVAAMGTVVAAAAAGDLTIEEARDLAEIIDAFRKAHEIAEIERRLVALERGLAHGPVFTSD